MKRPTKVGVIAPFLWGLFPVVFLLGANVDQSVPLRDVLWPAMWVLTGVALLLLAIVMATRSIAVAALMTTVLVIIFLLYGHVWNLVAEVMGGQHLYLLIIMGSAAVLLLVAIRQKRGAAETLTRHAALIAFILIALNLVPIVKGAATHEASPDAQLAIRATSVPAGMPDIYYIIFDRYAGEDVLRERYAHDNGPFLDSLRDRGFFVADDSFANYPMTVYSLASSLNMTHLLHLEQQYGPGSTDWRPLQGMLKDSLVPRFLQDAGYKYVHMGSFWDPTATDPSADVEVAYEAPSEFSTVFYRTTALWPLAELTGLSPSLDERRQQWERVRFQFEKLAQVSADPDPTFAFAHFTVPHPPYVFDPSGGFRSERSMQGEDPRASYRAQLRYTNHQIDNLIDRLLDVSEGERPIVLLQSDEGPYPPRTADLKSDFDWTTASPSELREKFSILNAFYFPDGGYEDLYPEVSPVNSFRLLFDRYFGTSLGQLPDMSYFYSEPGQPYSFRKLSPDLLR